MAGMIWNKQFYHFDVARWQDGDKIAPPKERVDTLFKVKPISLIFV